MTTKIEAAMRSGMVRINNYSEDEVMRKFCPNNFGLRSYFQCCGNVRIESKVMEMCKECWEADVNDEVW